MLEQMNINAERLDTLAELIGEHVVCKNCPMIGYCGGDLICKDVIRDYLADEPEHIYNVEIEYSGRQTFNVYARSRDEARMEAQKLAMQQEYPQMKTVISNIEDLGKNE